MNRTIRTRDGGVIELSDEGPSLSILIRDARRKERGAVDVDRQTLLWLHAAIEELLLAHPGYHPPWQRGAVPLLALSAVNRAN